MPKIALKFKIAEKRKSTVCIPMAVSGSVYTARHISCSFWGGGEGGGVGG